jgi:hypothetical protein
MTVRGYNSAKVLFAFSTVLAKELAAGEFCTIVYNSDQFTLVMGADGKGTRSPTNDNSAKITLKLMQSSPINAALSAILNTDLLLGNGSGIGPLAVRDGSGFSAYGAESAWITKWPDVSFDITAKERVWVFETDDLRSFEGGN